ncbi:MAG: lysophospholipid acyltransferase family protein [Ilumatobacteraceae bacterium]
MARGSGANAAQRRARRVLAPIARRVWDVEMKGYERLPAEGPAILCPNHISFIDSAFLMLTLPRNISFVGKAEYMDSWKTKFVFPALGMIPLDRAGGAGAQTALDEAVDVLQRGELFGIYPEGTRSRDGALYKGRTGAARLALEIGCPIYPVGIVGTDKIQRPGAKAPKPFKSCSISIGRPIGPDRYRDRREPHLAWRSMIDEVMFEIRDLTGQEYRNHYSGEPADAVTERPMIAHPASVTDAPPERQLVGAGR